MKSIKKRFKLSLATIERAAAELLLLSADISMLEAVQSASSKVLSACEALRERARQLDKKDFSEQILPEEALLQLDELVDEDVISEVERRFSAAVANSEESPSAELLGQLLSKLEKRYAVMVESIQQLGGLLNAE